MQVAVTRFNGSTSYLYVDATDPARALEIAADRLAAVCDHYVSLEIGTDELEVCTCGAPFYAHRDDDNACPDDFTPAGALELEAPAPVRALRHHVSGAIARGEAVPIIEELEEDRIYRETLEELNARSAAIAGAGRDMNSDEQRADRAARLEAMRVLLAVAEARVGGPAGWFGGVA